MKARVRGVTLILVALILVAVVGGTGCRRQEQSEKGKQLSVITTLFPLYDFTKNIAGGKASVTLLLPPGVEAHSFEPKAGDMVRISRADIFIYTGAHMEPWAENILKGAGNQRLLVVDASRGVTIREGTEGSVDGTYHDHGKLDPHIWLDLANAEKMVDTIRAALTERDPANEAVFTMNAEAYKVKLRALDTAFKKTLQTCRKDTFIHGGHFAFGYLAARYGLHYVSAYHGSPDAEPTPQRLVALKRQIKAKGIHYIYYEELIEPRVAEVLARETGAKLLKLHGGHNVTKEEFEGGISFLAIMEGNLNNLKVGLECR